MATQGTSSNSRLIMVGAVVLLFGVILVLLILRGAVGGEDAPTPAAAQADDGPDEREQDPEESALVADGEGTTARIPLPLDLDQGVEAVAVQAAFARGVAALPEAGDRVVVYRVAAGGETDGEDESTGAPAGDAERVLDEADVLGVIGPRPAANDGTLTFVLGLDEDDVPGLLPLARDAQLWLTLLPADDVDTGDGS